MHILSSIGVHTTGGAALISMPAKSHISKTPR